MGPGNRIVALQRSLSLVKLTSSIFSFVVSFGLGFPNADWVVATSAHVMALSELMQDLACSVVDTINPVPENANCLQEQLVGTRDNKGMTSNGATESLLRLRQRHGIRQRLACLFGLKLQAIVVVQMPLLDLIQSNHEPKRWSTQILL